MWRVKVKKILMEIIITIVIVSAAWYFYHKNALQSLLKNNDSLSNELRNTVINRDYQINKVVHEKMEELNNQILDLKKQIVITDRESYDKGKKQAEDNFANDFFVQVNPYKRVFKEKNSLLGSFMEKEKVEIGYQYQLFVKGIPTLNPAVIVIETYEAKQFHLNEETIKALVDASLGPKTELIGGFVKVAKNIIEKK
jgi:hypothetical protein